MPLNDPHHISPTGVRVSPLPKSDTAPRPQLHPVTVSASQLNADIADYLLELEELRRLVTVKVISEIDSREVTELRDTVAERDAEIDTLRAMIADEDK